MKNARNARTVALVALAILAVVGLSSIAVGSAISGTVQIDGDSAVDGSTFSYELDDEDEVDDLTVGITGVDNKESESYTETLSNQDDTEFTVGGSDDPTDETLTLEGVTQSEEVETSGSLTSESTETIDVSENIDPQNATLRITSDQIEQSDDTDQNADGAVYSFDIDSDVDEMEVDLYNDHHSDHNVDIDVFADGEHLLSDSVTVDEGSGNLPRTTTHTIDMSGYDLSDIDNLDVEGSAGIDYYELQIERVSLIKSYPDVDVSYESGSKTFEESDDKTKEIDLVEGSNNLHFDFDYEGIDWELDYDAVEYTLNPEVYVNGESYEYNGELESGESEEYDIDLGLGTTDISVFTESESKVTASVEWVEVTETVDPSISVNGQTADHSGTLDDGETASLDVDESWIESGTNEVEVGVDDPDEGPVGQVDLDYSHSTTGDAHSSSTDSTEWSEDRVVERTFSEDREDVEIEIPLDDRVVDVQSVDVWIDGTETVVDYNLNGTDFTADIGHVEEGEDVEVAVDAYKVSVSGGDIEIINATPEGETMATEFEIYPDGDGEFGVEVSGTVWGDRLHEFEEVGWDDDGTYVEVASDGDQVLRTPNAQSGSEASVGVTDLSVDPNAGVVEADPLGGTGEPGDDDFAHQRVELEFDGASDVEVGYHDTVSGEVYGLERVSDDVEVDTAQASSPVYLTAYESDTYQIVPSEFESAIGAGTPQEQDDSLPGPTWLWLIVGVGGATALVVDVLTPGGRFTAGVARRVWGVVTSVVSLIPFVDIGSSSRGRSRQQSSGVTDATPSRGVLAVAAVGLSAIGLLAAELVTPRSVFFDLPAMVLSGAITGVTTTVAGSAFMPVLTGVGALLALWAFDVTTDTPMARWVQVVAVSTVVVYVVESIQPGTLLGPLSEAVETTLPLLILGGVFVLWRWSNNRGDTTEVTIDSDD